MENQQTSSIPKRNTAYKHRIGAILSGKQNVESEKLKNVEINGKEVVRVNLIANVTDKYVQEGEKKFGSITLDDGTGQIKVKTFGDDVERFFGPLNQGDTVLVVGLLRIWNNEVYVNPEIIKNKDAKYLLVRKLEVEAEETKPGNSAETHELKNKLLDMIKDSEKNQGIDVEKIILDLKEKPDVINQEIKKLLEDGVAYEPRPGRVRWLG